MIEPVTLPFILIIIGLSASALVVAHYIVVPLVQAVAWRWFSKWMIRWERWKFKGGI